MALFDRLTGRQSIVSRKARARVRNLSLGCHRSPPTCPRRILRGLVWLALRPRHPAKFAALVAACSASNATHSATNAGKYGALSTEKGRVDVFWGIDGDTLAMSWSERDGPLVSAPEEHGFGCIVTSHRNFSAVTF
jgi:hypothetical protein